MRFKEYLELDEGILDMLKNWTGTAPDPIQSLMIQYLGDKGKSVYDAYQHIMQQKKAGATPMPGAEWQRFIKSIARDLTQFLRHHGSDLKRMGFDLETFANAYGLNDNPLATGPKLANSFSKDQLRWGNRF